MTVPLHLKVATGGFLRHLPKKSSLSSVPARAASELLQVVRDNTVPCKIIPLLHLPFSCHLNTEIRLPQKVGHGWAKKCFPQKMTWKTGRSSGFLYWKHASLLEQVSWTCSPPQASAPWTWRSAALCRTHQATRSIASETWTALQMSQQTGLPKVGKCL
jgi:hypothetical protein